MATTMIHFDTHHYINTLRKAGFSEGQAEAFSKAQQVSLSECLDTTLATKADLIKLEFATKADIADLREETKADIAALSKETKADIAILRKETKADIAALSKETKAEIAALSKETKADIAALSKETKADIAELRKEMTEFQFSTQTNISGLRIEIKTLESTVHLHSWMLSLIIAGIATLILKAFF